MSQVIELPSSNNKYEAIKDSIKNTTAELLRDIEKEDIIGFYIVKINKDNTTDFYSSAGVDRQRKIGILMDLIYSLLKD